MLGEEVEDIVKKLQAREYLDVIKDLDSLVNSVKNTILSEELPEEMSSELDPLLDSLISCGQLVFHNYRKKGLLEPAEQEKVVLFLDGTKNILKALASLEEWKVKMIEEWGK